MSVALVGSEGVDAVLALLAIIEALLALVNVYAGSLIFIKSVTKVACGLAVNAPITPDGIYARLRGTFTGKIILDTFVNIFTSSVRWIVSKSFCTGRRRTPAGISPVLIEATLSSLAIICPFGAFIYVATPKCIRMPGKSFRTVRQ